MDSKILILGIVGAVGIVVIAFVVVYQFVEQQDDRQKAVDAIKRSEERAEAYQTCLKQNRHIIENLKKADAIIEQHNRELIEAGVQNVEPYAPKPGICDHLK